MSKKKVNFDINQDEVRMIDVLKKKLNKTLAAIFREALRLYFKKETK